MFTPFAFVKSAEGGPFNPELISNLYYWWDFTDSGSMTFSSGTTIATVNNKATRTSSNETLNTVTGTPEFISTTSGSKFLSGSYIGNTSTNSQTGDLDTLFNGADATVIWIGKLDSWERNPSTDLDENVLWGAAGTGFDDVHVGITNFTQSVGGGGATTSCSADNGISTTYNVQYNFHDYTDVSGLGSDRYTLRTYESSSVNPTNQFSFFAVAPDMNSSPGGYTDVKISVNGQAFCNGTIPNNRTSQYDTNRGFVVNARSRQPDQIAGMTANQYIQHLLIYNGILSDSDITTLYNNWLDSL